MCVNDLATLYLELQETENLRGRIAAADFFTRNNEM